MTFYRRNLPHWHPEGKTFTSRPAIFPTLWLLTFNFQLLTLNLQLLLPNLSPQNPRPLLHSPIQGVRR